MVKHLYAFLHENLPDRKASIPSVTSLSDLQKGCVAIDVLSFVKQMQISKNRVTFQDISDEMTRMARVCVNQDFPILFLLGSANGGSINGSINGSEEESKESKRSKGSKGSLQDVKTLTTKIANLTEKADALQDKRKQIEWDEQDEAQLIVFQDKKRRLVKQLDRIRSASVHHVSIESWESQFREFLQHLQLPHISTKDITHLLLQNKIQYIASEENDHLVSLACQPNTNTALFRNFLWHVRSPNQFPFQYYQMDKILSDLTITNRQFFEMCYLLGFQDVPCIPGMGKKRIYNGIVQHGDVETLLEKKHKRLFLDKTEKKEYLTKLDHARDKCKEMAEFSDQVDQVEIPSAKTTWTILEKASLTKKRRLYEIVDIRIR